MIEGLSPSEILVGSYYSSLSVIGKNLFNNLFTEVSEEVVSISKAIKTRSIKLRKQVSAVTKRHSKKKVARADKALFQISDGFTAHSVALVAFRNIIRHFGTQTFKI